MTADALIVDRLSDAVGVTSLVGSRVFLVVLPQRVTFPAIRVQLIDEPATYHARGANGLTRARVQIDCFADVAGGSNPYTLAMSVAEAVDDSISGQVFSDTGSPTTTMATGCFRQERMVMYEQADDRRLVRVMQDYYVWSKAMN